MKAMVIGLGRVGWQYSLERGRGLAASHLGAYCVQKEIDTIIAVDKNKKRLSECARWLKKTGVARDKELHFASDCSEAMRKWTPEIASVCVPTPCHLQVMQELCRAQGPRVICLEKPVAPSLREAREIEARVANSYADVGKPKVAVNFTRRWDARYIQVKHLIDKGRIGKPLLAIGSHPGPMLRSGIHMLDLFNWYLGEPDWAAGFAEDDENWMTQRFPDTNDWNGSGWIHYRNGSYAVLANMGLNVPSLVLFELRIHGDKGALKIEDNGRTIRLQHLSRSKHYSSLKELVTQKITEPKAKRKPMPRMVDDLVRCVKNRTTNPQCTLDDAIKAQTLVHLIRQSRTRGVLRILSPTNADSSETIRSH